MPETEVKPVIVNQLMGTMEQFQVEKSELWPSYEERFELYCSCNGIVDQKRKTAIFVNLAGPQVFEILKTTVSPKKVIEMNYDEVVTILNNFFIPKPSSITSFYWFVQRSQLPDENVLQYFKELQKIAIYCKFGTLMDELLIKRVICGLRDVTLQKSYRTRKTKLPSSNS